MKHPKQYAQYFSESSCTFQEFTSSSLPLDPITLNGDCVCMFFTTSDSSDIENRLERANCHGIDAVVSTSIPIVRERLSPLVDLAFAVTTVQSRFAVRLVESSVNVRESSTNC